MVELAKAELRELEWRQNQPVSEINNEKWVTVQFNPETLKLSYTNQKSGGDQRGGSATQFVGKGTTKLSLDLVFDLTTPQPTGADSDAAEITDVRKLTQKVNYFIQPKPAGNDKFLPPGIRFVWGSFLFDGVVDSINETLEYFSKDGRPLRATIALSISSQEIQFVFNPDFDPASAATGQNGAPGTQPLDAAQEDDSVQQMASRAGKPDQWSDIAAANNIENPRQLAAGTLVNMQAGVSAGISGGVSGGISAGISGGLSAGVSGGISAGVSGGISAGAGISGGVGAGVSGGLSASAGVSAGLGASLSAGVSAGADAAASLDTFDPSTILGMDVSIDTGDLT